MSDGAGAAWRGDPYLRHELRYWDGRIWTDQVSDLGVLGHDPVFPVHTGDADRFLTKRAGRRRPRRRARRTSPRTSRPGASRTAGPPSVAAWAVAGFCAVVAVAAVAGVVGADPSH